MLYVLVLAVHVLVSLFLVMVVLLQSGRSGDIASAFGGGGAQTVFGPRATSTVLSKATTWSAVIFMITSIALVVLTQGGGRSVVREAGSPAPAPAAPTTPAPPPTPQPGN